MEKTELNEPRSFIVKESIAINVIAALVCWIMFFCAINYNEFSDATPRTNNRLFYLTIIPAILFSVKATRNKPIIEINNNGFFYNGSLITSWENFVSIKYTQDEIVGSYSDNFVLLIKYNKPGYENSFITKLSLGNTQNKGEEDVIQATEFYYSKWREKTA